MRKLLSLIFATISITPIFAAQYAGVEIGLNHAILTNHSDTDLKTGMSGSVKYGYCFESGIRAEAQAIYRTNRFKTIYNFAEKDQILSKEYNSHHSWAYMLNVLYDVKPLQTYDIVPYLGLGVGYCQNTENHKLKFDDHSIQDKLKDNRFAYQGIVGAKYGIQDNIVTGMEYRYFTGNNHKKDHSIAMFVLRTF
jgi:OmpA-OmpF porin, OOP family